MAVGVLAWSPAPRVSKGPGIVTVDLVAMAAPAAGPAAARAARTASPAPAPARSTEAPTPLPRPEPPRPTPPPPEPRREAALPKSSPPPEPKKPRERAQADPKPEPKPDPVKAAAAQPAPKPEPARAERKPAPPPPAEPKPEPARAATPPAAAPTPPAPAAPSPRREESYDDVLASLRAERGESRPEQVGATASAGVPGATGVSGASARGAGRPMDAEVAFWLRAAKLHVESAWVVPPGFRREALRTVVSVRLDGSGRVVGAPQVRERSGNPWYDESVVRAIQKASPLPPPPEAGEWRFEFTPPGSTG